MSFLRPDAVRELRRWAETIAATLTAAVVLWAGLSLATTGRLLGWGLLAVFGPPAAMWLRAAYSRARLVSTRQGPGIVTIDERRIGYLGPQGGGFVDLDGLRFVEIAVTMRGRFAPDIFWVLHHFDGPPVNIPTSADGADELLDAFAALPGFSLDRVVEAMSSTQTARITIWRRDG